MISVVAAVSDGSVGTETSGKVWDLKVAVQIMAENKLRFAFPDAPAKKPKSKKGGKKGEKA